MLFDTTRFGQITVKQENVINFPSGPLGFPDCTRFAFVDEEQAAPFRILQSLDNPALGFVVVNPSTIRPDYKFDLTLKDIELVGSSDVEELETYCILCMAGDIKDITVNLQGPLVINARLNIGHQFVLVDSDYTVKESLTTRGTDD